MFAPPALLRITLIGKCMSSQTPGVKKGARPHTSGINASFHDEPQGVRYRYRFLCSFFLIAVGAFKGYCAFFYSDFCIGVGLFELFYYYYHLHDFSFGAL